MSLYLEPFGLGAEVLNRIDLNERNNHNPTHKETFTLGRNEFTGLSDDACAHFQNISRKHALITYDCGRVFLNAVGSQGGLVYVNGQSIASGTVELHVGDSFSMLGFKKYYNYFLKRMDPLSLPALSDGRPFVNLLNSSSDCGNSDSSNGSSSVSDHVRLTINQTSQSQNSVVRTQSFGKTPPTSMDSMEARVTTATASSLEDAAPAAPPPTGSAEMKHKIMKDITMPLLRQYECSICYETLACAVSLSPCGDCFCYMCIADWVVESKHASGTETGAGQCPLCQGSFSLSTSLPNRLADTTIREVLKIFPEELSAWETRMQAGLDRRRADESASSASTGGAKSSSSSSLNRLVPVPAPAPASSAMSSASRQPSTPFGSGHSSSASHAMRRGGAPEIVELLDSQPAEYVDPFYRHRIPAAAAAPRPSGGLFAYFGPSAQQPAAVVQPPPTRAGMVPVTSLVNVAFPSSSRKRNRAWQDADSSNGGSAVQNVEPSSSSSNSGGGNTVPTRRPTGGAVFDLTASSSSASSSPPPVRVHNSAMLNTFRDALMRNKPPTEAVTQPNEVYALVRVQELPFAQLTKCSKCAVDFRGESAALGIYCRVPSDRTILASENATKGDWQRMCRRWYHRRCVMEDNAERRLTCPPGTWSPTSVHPRSAWPIQFLDVKFTDVLPYTSCVEWQQALRN